jgi:hypothetical protein
MILDLLNYLGISNTAYIPNAISGLFSFVGVLFTGLAAICAWIAKQVYTRWEKRKDLRSALLAEIEVQWRMLFFVPRSADLLTEIERRMRMRGGSRYAPFFTRYLEPPIFNEIKSEITALGREEIPHIVRFYHHMAVLDNYVAELRADAFKRFQVERKLQMIKHLFLMIDRGTEFAEEAMKVLERQLNLPESERLKAIKSKLEKSLPPVGQPRVN